MTRRALLAIAALFQVRVPRPSNTRIRQVFRTIQPSYPLQARNDPMVYVNGVLMCPGDDYRIDGAVLTFTGQAIEGPVIIQFIG